MILVTIQTVKRLSVTRQIHFDMSYRSCGAARRHSGADLEVAVQLSSNTVALSLASLLNYLLCFSFFPTSALLLLTFLYDICGRWPLRRSENC